MFLQTLLSELSVLGEEARLVNFMRNAVLAYAELYLPMKGWGPTDETRTIFYSEDRLREHAGDVGSLFV
jgi:hypothetical protein